MIVPQQPVARLGPVLVAFAIALGACGVSTETAGPTATLMWDRPSVDADGTPLGDLAGFRLYHGTSTPFSAATATSVELGDVTTHTTPALAPGRHGFAVTAVDTAGNESAWSNVVTHEVRGAPVGAGSRRADHAALAPAGTKARITGIRFDWETYVYLAPGSDNWPLTWCEDGHQYTSWGDGGGFGGTDDDGRVSLGFARIEGDYPAFTPHNVWGGKDAEQAATFSGKVVSMLCLRGVLYAWRSDGSNASAFNWKELARSADKGASWTIVSGSRLDGDVVGAPGLPFYLSYGQNYTANGDGYVYTYSIRLTDPDTWEVQRPGVTWLARGQVAGEAFVRMANWEWFAGFDERGSPTWGAMADRVAVLEDPDGFMRGSALYVPTLDRFVMVTNHTARNRGNIAIWEARAPWGPWTLVRKESGWPRGGEVEQTFAFGNFSPKWLRRDGSCVFVWFRPDAWNSVACQFEVSDPPAGLDSIPPLPPTNLRIVAVP